MTDRIDDKSGLPDGLGDAPPESETAQILLTPEQRKAFLGRLAEFEMLLGGMNDNHANFVLAVLADPSDYTKAARVAGYKFPNVEATRLLNKPHIAAAIALGEQLREDRTMVTSDRTLHEFAIIAFSDITNYVISEGKLTVREGIPAYMTRAVSAIEIDETAWTDEEGICHTRTKTKLRLWSKTDALKMLAMYQKLLSGEGGTNIGTQNVDARQVTIHQHQHNTWQIGDNKVTF
jgi:hypothetical protein